jgi:hypothetical protein
MDGGMFGISIVGSTMDRHDLFGNDNLCPPVCTGEKMKNTLLSFLVLAAALLLNPNLARAHHGWAAFASESQITLKGKVTEFHFVNPHAVVEFEVKDDKGQVQSWEGELSSRSNLGPRGWTAASLEDKEEITITGYPAKNGSHAMRVTRIVLSNGKELKPGGGN